MRTNNLSLLRQLNSVQMVSALAYAMILGSIVTIPNFASAFPYTNQEMVKSGGGNDWLGSEEDKAKLTQAAESLKEGRHLLKIGDTEGAERLFLTALESDPCVQKHGHACASSFSDLADIYYRKQMWKKAVANYRRHANYALGESGGGLNMYDASRYSVALLQLGDSKTALAAYNHGVTKIQGEAEELDAQMLPTVTSARRLEAIARTAVACTELVDDALMKRECDRALKVLPDYPQAHLILGNYYIKLKKPAEARNEWERASNLSRAGSAVQQKARQKLSIY